MTPAAPSRDCPSNDARKTCRNAFARFASDESGAMTYFILVLFVLMILMGGMAVDLMRYENHRTALQQTTDRSVLAAASLRQTQEPEPVVDDYFKKAGMFQYLIDRKGEKTLNGRSVWAKGRDVMPTFFMRMLDVPQLPATAFAKAEEGVGNIEISLVIDISGSMREGANAKATPPVENQITQLRAAAKAFFAIVLKGDAAATTSINVVPYAGNVNVGRDLFDRLNGVRRFTAPSSMVPPMNDRPDASCLDLKPEDFLAIGKPAPGRLQVPFFMNWTIDLPTMNWGWCPTDNSRIQIAQNDITKLDAFIDNIRLHDGTGTHIGVKYGAMLLDPNLRGIFAALPSSVVPAQFSDRPLGWSTSVGSDVKKYLIVMTDGAITQQYEPRDWGVVDTDSDKLDNEKYTIKVKELDKDGKETGNMVDGVVDDPDLVDGTDRQWLNLVKELQNQPSGAWKEISSITQNVDRFDDQCLEIKKKGVTVFTIAFNANATAQGQMSRCSSGPSYFYNAGVNDAKLKAALEQIGRTIRQLRLTQ